MKSRNDRFDPKDIVKLGYNTISERYTAWAKSVRSEEREHYTDFLLRNVSPGAKVLELGCGAGDPTTMRLAERFAVTGVDISETQIKRARTNVPQASFMLGDISSLEFCPGSFDAVTAFYSFTHLPRKEQRPLLRAIADWLRPGGLFVASLSSGSNSGDVDQDWLGAPMFFSGYAARTNRHLVRAAGLEILSSNLETSEEFGRPATFLWIISRKPG